MFKTIQTLSISFNLTITRILLLTISLITFFFEAQTSPLSTEVFLWVSVWLMLAILFTTVAIRYFTVGFLLGLFSLLVAWRILELYHFKFVSFLLSVTFLLQLIQFIYWVWTSCHDYKKIGHKNNVLAWQLTFIRMYVGFDFIPHFTEKLFAGDTIRMTDVQAFTSLGIPHADLIVWLAGVCEFAAALSLSSGFILRLGAFGTTLYLLIATYLGNHFSLGFIWVNHGGGWEFAVMWAFIIFSFGFTGAHNFSFDQCLEKKYRLPYFIKRWL